MNEYRGPRTNKNGRRRTNKRLTTALVVGGLFVASSAALPAGFLPDSLTVMDPDRTVRQVLAPPAPLVRAFAALSGALLIGIGALLRRKPSWIPRFGSSPQPRASATDITLIWAVGLLTLLGIGLRAYYLTMPLSYDEAHTYVFFSSRTWIDALSDYSIPNNHLLHSLLAHFSISLFGDSTLALRLPAVLAGILSIPMAYAAGLRLSGPLTGVVMAAVAAASHAAVEYSTQARGYSLVLLFFLLSVWAAERIKREGKGWGVLVFAWVAGGFTIPGFVLPMGAVAIWMCISEWRDRPFLRALTLSCASTAALLAILYLPAIGRSGWDAIFNNYYVAPRAYEDLVGLWRSSGNKIAACWTGTNSFAGRWGVVAAAVATMLASRREENVPARLAVVCAGWVVVFGVLRRVDLPARGLHWIEPIAVGAVALAIWGQGIASVPRLREASRRGVVTTLVATAAIWGVVNVYSHRLASSAHWPGAQQATHCAEGYFADAESIATDFLAVAGDEDILVAHRYSGMTSPLRSYLLLAGNSPVLAHAVSPRDGIAHLAAYQSWFVVAYTRSLPPPAISVSPDHGPDHDAMVATIARAMGVSAVSVSPLIESVELWKEYPVSVVYLVSVRTSADARKPTGKEIMRYPGA